LLGAFVPVLGVFALMLTVALYAAEAAGEGWIARIVPSQSCNSILAAVPAHRRELRRVVVVAAMDSHGTGVLDRGPVAFIGRHVSRLIVLCGLVAVVLLAIQALASPPPPDSILIVPAIALLTLLALVAEPTLRRSPAERDDASAELLRSIVELGATLRAQPARWVDVWCFVAGGGSVSGEALRQFIQDNQFSRETTYFINLIPDADTVTFALAEGALWKRRSAPVLVRILAAASGTRPNSRLARNTQCAVAIGMGYQALTIGIPASHDVQDNLDGTDSTSLLAAAMSAIDHDLVERNRVARLARPAQSRPTRPIRPPQT
jgi:hypothetical protein